jgi:uncharacterized membrane protein YccF (DUF307 family)
MRTIGNLLWMILGGGIFISFFYLIGGLVICLTIIGIPFGIQLIKLGIFSLAPFGQTLNYERAGNGCLNLFFNILWIILGGFYITIIHMVFALLTAITIVGLPFAKQHIKLAAFALIPFGTISYSDRY